MAEPILLKVREVQELTGLGRTKLYELIRKGELPVVRIGRVVRIRRDSLNRWLEALEQEADMTLPW